MRKTKLRAKPGPRPKATASSNGTPGTLTIQDITTVKSLLSRLGKSSLDELIAALA
jgi:hypothetical protein